MHSQFLTTRNHISCGNGSKIPLHGLHKFYPPSYRGVSKADKQFDECLCQINWKFSYTIVAWNPMPESRPLDVLAVTAIMYTGWLNHRLAHSDGVHLGHTVYFTFYAGFMFWGLFFYSSKALCNAIVNLKFQNNMARWQKFSCLAPCWKWKLTIWQ